MPYNPTLLLATELSADTFNLKCPFKQDAICSTVECVSGNISTIDGKSYFTGCLLIDRSMGALQIENNDYVIYYTANGTPVSGLTPTIDIYKVISDNSDVTPIPDVTEIGDGAYKFNAAPIAPYFVRVDSNDETMNDSDRYKIFRIAPGETTSMTGDLTTLETTLAAFYQAYLDNVNNSMVENQLDTLIDWAETIDSDMTSTHDTIKHIHQLHLHTKSHFASDQPNEMGPKTLLNIQPPIILLQELTTKTDADGNGLVYGVDFIISKNDPNKPPILINVEQTYTPSRNITTMMYADYLTSIKWPGE